MGPVAPGAQLSQNHWSIYLIIKGGGSVRLNMETDPTPGKHEGIFKVTRHQYEMTTSCVRHWDCPATDNITVGRILKLIGEKRRNRYRMTPTGVGCRHWVLTIIGDLVNAGYIGDTNATATLNQVIQFNYSRNQHPVALPMLKGSFY
ncbi:hypothetical protein ABEF92_000304 [Exophiala dermatitidis]|uniref:DUF7770 domain-containing protein n=2 Tax=Exophiala dermatitidis TaxID=5970 RepID=H6C9D9_EXODN|nr:uncharacterized protein HMPREF1120_08658 [Exophiala dermatitidis NIH/UT8656]EHY60709.1 hypothetical protein HMPREF1120_08658 [Exophiala dermatitidis NIH/UT8656]KAJ4524845.1 hypothetical protein HRR75_000436 [Exophiala dermatitidis]